MWCYAVYAGLLAVIALCLLPAYFVWWALATAAANGCTVNEAGATPCLVGGTDIGGELAAAFVSGWHRIATTLPVAAACALALVILAVRDVLRHWRGRAR